MLLKIIVYPHQGMTNNIDCATHIPYAVRIMQTYGFSIKAMWFSGYEDKIEFVYILEWADTATLERQWTAFMADSEWEEIKRKSREEHGEIVLAKVRDQVLESTTWFDNKI